MELFELKCTAYLKKDIKLEEVFNSLSKYINYCMCQNENFAISHNQNRYTDYSFSGLTDKNGKPEKDKIYKSGQTYSFIIRTIDEKLCEVFMQTLRTNINNGDLLVLEVAKKIIKRFFITELYTLTPTVVTIAKEPKGYDFWTLQKNGDIVRLQKQLQDNLLKKYKSFYGEEIQPIQNFIQLIELKNNAPQSIYFDKKTKEKTIRVRLLGNKFRIVPNEDETSQKLAFLALGCGLGEKNSYGGGFVLGRGMR